VSIDIEPGTAYLMQMSQADRITLWDDQPCVKLNLAAGAHLISHPAPEDGLGCLYWLAQLDPTKVSALRWLDPESDRQQTCGSADGGAGSVQGVDFLIEAGEGYWLSLREAVQLQMGNCP